MKRYLALILVVVTVFSLVACGGDGTSDGTVDTENGASTASLSDTKKDPAEKDNGNASAVFDPEAEHLFLATDIRNGGIVIFDLDACNGNYELLKDDSVAVVWEWRASEDPNCVGNPGEGIDAAKLRYSSYYKKDVIIACSSAGWCGVIDYEARTVLWEYTVSGGGPHSVEMLPNGDLVIGVSGDAKKGSVRYVPLSAGETLPSHTLYSPSCHGLQWDPENEVLWVLDYDEVYACTVSNPGTKRASLSRVKGSEDLFGDVDVSGHVLSPVYGQPGKYWVSAHKYLWQFDTDTGKLTRSYNRASTLTRSNVKGVASFSDGTVIMTYGGLGTDTTYDWSSLGFRITTFEMSGGKIKQPKPKTTEVIFENREFYKVYPLSKEYQ